MAKRKRQISSNTDQDLIKRLQNLKKRSNTNLISEMRFKSGLTVGGKKMRFDSFKPMEGKKIAYRKAMQWNPDSGKGLIFYGPPGVGKSHLGCALANKLISEGTFVKFLRTVDIPKENTEEVEKLFDPDECPVLILDDLGAEKSTERALECLYSIIDGRIWRGAPMVITTNFKSDDLAERLNNTQPGYGDRLLSRLNKACEFIPIGGHDMRKD